MAGEAVEPLGLLFSFQTRKLRLREGKRLTQGHAVGDWRRREGGGGLTPNPVLPSVSHMASPESVEKDQVNVNE